MQIRRIDIAPDDAAAAEQIFGSIPTQAIACCNWPEQFPYTPQVSFRMFHTGERLWLRFDVSERYTAALVTEDNGEVWTDSCAEFFLAPDETGYYYNFETSCIGRMLLGYRHTHADAVHAAPEAMASVRRFATLPAEPFAEHEGDNRWSLTLCIPPQALFRHRIATWDGLEARMNLYKCGDRLSHPHYLSWRPVASERPDFHRPESFGRVVFEKGRE